MMRRLALALIVLVVPARVSSVALARTQTPAPPRGALVVTVADPGGGLIPGATVTATLEAVPPGEVASPLQTFTGMSGVATLAGLAPGRYSVTVEFQGFETVTIANTHIRAGENRLSVVLPLKKITEHLAVARDARTAGLDPRGHAFSTVLTREQIAALPDDPEQMEEALKAMAPPGAVIRIDGFTGGRLPPKSQIRSIRLPRMDQMAAQYHGGISGTMFIEIMTQPGNGPLSGTLDAGFRDDALNARNPFTPSKGDEGLRSGLFSLTGSIVPNRSSFALSVQRSWAFDSSVILAATSGGTVAQSIRRPTVRTHLNARVDQAVGDGHLLRFSYQHTASDAANLGVGSFDLAERAYRSSSFEHVARFSENGPVGRRGFSESRLQFRWSGSEATPAIEAPTLRVLDAFTSGGAQRRGRMRAFDLEAATDIDYVRGVHVRRAGVLVEGGRYRSSDALNYLGTYTFASLADYEAGRPSNYTRRLGDPDVSYANLQVAAYWQDDWRLRTSLVLSYGLRYEIQSILADRKGLSPRAMLTWSPLGSGHTTLRAGAGWFHDWLAGSVYEQTLRVDGFRQREVNVLDPAFPDPGGAGSFSPSNRYQLTPTLRLPASLTITGGVEQTVSRSLRASVTYTHRRSVTQLRGRNLNRPVDGLRPDPRFSNVVDVVGDAGLRTHAIGATVSFMKPSWRQAILVGYYTWSRMMTNTTGPFAPPASGDDLSTEWGPAVPSQRFMASFSIQPIPRLSVTLNARAQSGMPYTVLAGRDLNGDGVFNDRPAGVGRNTERTAAHWDLGARVSYAFGFGRRPSAPGPGGGTMMVAGGSGLQSGVGPGAGGARYQLQCYAAVQNLTNRPNYTGYSGVLSSPFFGRPTAVLNPRTVELGVRFGF